MELLQTAGTAMTSGDGVTCHCHPIFATFMSNYPEQVLATRVKTGECPGCECPRDKLGDGDNEYEHRHLGKILDALATFDDPDTQVFMHTCREARIKPIIHPFWENLPYMDIYCSIAPDILHQLYQGVIKHLFMWLRSAFSVAEIDAWC